MSSTADLICSMTFDEVVAFVHERARADRLPVDRDLMAAFDEEYARVDAAAVPDDSGVFPAILALFPTVTASRLLRAANQVIAEAGRIEAFQRLLGRQVERAQREMPPEGDPALMREFAEETALLVDAWPDSPRMRGVA